MKKILFMCLLIVAAFPAAAFGAGESVLTLYTQPGRTPRCIPCDDLHKALTADDRKYLSIIEDSRMMPFGIGVPSLRLSNKTIIQGVDITQVREEIAKIKLLERPVPCPTPRASAAPASIKPEDLPNESFTQVLVCTPVFIPKSKKISAYICKAYDNETGNLIETITYDQQGYIDFITSVDPNKEILRRIPGTTPKKNILRTFPFPASQLPNTLPPPPRGTSVSMPVEDDDFDPVTPKPLVKYIYKLVSISKLKNSDLYRVVIEKCGLDGNGKEIKNSCKEEDAFEITALNDQAAQKIVRARVEAKNDVNPFAPSAGSMEVMTRVLSGSDGKKYEYKAEIKKSSKNSVTITVSWCTLGLNPQCSITPFEEDIAGAESPQEAQDTAIKNAHAFFESKRKKNAPPKITPGDVTGTPKPFYRSAGRPTPVKPSDAERRLAEIAEKRAEEKKRQEELRREIDAAKNSK